MEFRDVEFMTAKEKELVLKQWITFVKNGFQLKHFTKGLYHHLMQHCSFIAHYDRGGFYSTYFERPEDTVRFLAQFDLDEGGESTEYGGIGWRQREDYTDINTAMCRAIDPYKDAIYARCQNQAVDRDVEAGIALLKARGITPEKFAQLIQQG